MLYLEDYLELIEHLPEELRDRLTFIRESDLKVNNSSEKLELKVKQFFAQAKDLTFEQRQCEYDAILAEFQVTKKYADEKVDISTQTHDIMVKLIQRLDVELEKFKLELEADHAGITEELERRSLELDAETQKLTNNGMLNGHLNNGAHQNHHSSMMLTNNHIPSVIKDRRRSEYKHRHHPYKNNLHHNGYNGRDRLSYQCDYNNTTSKNPTHHNNPRQVGSKHVQQQHSRQSSTASSPIPHSYSSSSAPGSVIGETNGISADNNHSSSYGNNNNITSFGFKNPHIKNNNIPLNQHQHSALSAALSSATPTTPLSTFAMMNNASVQSNKISKQQSSNLKSNDLIYSNNLFDRHNPLAAAASQAIAATQQLHQGRRTLSLKASFAAINAAGLNGSIDSVGHDVINRNALAPMPPDHQALRHYNHHGRDDGARGQDTNPLYVSVTKSGRGPKKPKHLRTSQLYPDESPTSISSDNSVFDNSESLSSVDFIESGTNFGSTSPSSLDLNNTTIGTNAGLHQNDDTKYCLCRQVSYGEMVACDNEECEIEWFHYGCVGVTQPPKGKWYCPECRPSMMNVIQRPQEFSNSHTTPSQQKKRGRKEKSFFDLMNNSIETTTTTTTTVKSNDRNIDTRAQ